MQYIQCSILYTLYALHCIISIVYDALFSMHCVLCIVLYALYYMHYILCIVLHCKSFFATLKLVTHRQTDQHLYWGPLTKIYGQTQTRRKNPGSWLVRAGLGRLVQDNMLPDELLVFASSWLWFSFITGKSSSPSCWTRTSKSLWRWCPPPPAPPSHCMYKVTLYWYLTHCSKLKLKFSSFSTSFHLLQVSLGLVLRFFILFGSCSQASCHCSASQIYQSCTSLRQSVF